MTPAKPIDKERLMLLCDDDAGEARELLSLAVHSTRDILDRMASSLQRNNLTEVKAALHEARGSAANVGALEIAAIAGDLEDRVGVDSNLTVVADSLPTLHEAVDRLMTVADRLED